MARGEGFGVDGEADSGDPGQRRPDGAGAGSGPAGHPERRSDEELGPPPAPFERPTSVLASPFLGAPGAGGAAPHGPSAEPEPRRRRRLPLPLTIVLAVAVGFVAGLASADVVELPEMPWRSAPAEPSVRDAALVELLEGIIASESIMLAFNDEVGERLDGATDEAVALAAVASAAADGATGLRAARPALLEQTGDQVVDDVRSAYIPHLDSWIDYLAALAERPGLLFTRDDQQPFLLLINSTAEAFADELEALLASGPSPEVAALAERILDDGFRSEREADV